MAGASGRKGFCYRKSRVKQFKTSFELLGVLPPRALEILSKLGAGNIATQVASMIGCSKSNVTYWKNKLLDMGALRLQCRDVVQIFSLTPYGSKLLARSERCGLEPVVLEDHAVKFVVVEHEKSPLDWRKLGQPRNWVKMSVKIGNVRVVKTSRHVIIHPGRLKGFDVDELKVEAGRVIERVKMVLEQRFGMVLSDEGIPLHKPIYRFYSPEARELAKAGTTIVDGVGGIDCSPPEKEPHEEYFREELAKDRILLPLTVKRLEEKVDALNNNVAELVETLKQLLEPPSPKSPGKVCYVA